LRNYRNTTWLAILLLLLSLLVGFISIEVVQRRRYADKERDLKAALSAFETKTPLTLDSDGVLIRPVRGTEPVRGRFKKVLGTWEGLSRVSTWYLLGEIWSTKAPATVEHSVHFEVELRQHRWILLGKPQVVVDWPLDLSRNAILPLLEIELRNQGIEYSLIDRGF